MKTTRLFRIRLLAAVLCTGLFSASAHAAYPVYDAGNAALNAQQIAKQAEEIAHTLEQIQNQIESLENQARMLQDLSVSNYAEAVEAMQRIRNVLRTHCVEIGAVPNRIGFDSGFDCAALMERFRRAYPAREDWSAQSDEQLAQYPRQWNTQRRAAAVKAMRTQDASVEAMSGAAQRMSELAEASQRAPGQKAAIQVTNQMLVTLSAQLRDRQATALTVQRARAMETAEEAAWRERNRELVRRVTHDARTDYSVPPVSGPFGS